MSHLERREATRNLNTLMFCGMVGLLVGLATATVVNYSKSQPDTDQFSQDDDQGEAKSPSQSNRLPKEYNASYPASRS
jgi:predicted histidine transporter YuiF (NhaC family)